MRLALVHPVYWPEVHRGSERIVHDLGAGLARRGHEVTLLTSHPGPTSESIEDGVRVIRSRRPPRLPGMGLYELFLETLPDVVRRLSLGRFDLAGAFHISSAFAAGTARSIGGPPVVYAFHGVATRTYLVARRHRLPMLRRCIERSRAVTTLSEAAADTFHHHLFVRPEVLPAGVDLAAFAPAERRYEQPTLLCAASFTDPRKRVRLLLEAFGRLRETRPEARLLLADNPDPSIAGVRPHLPAGAEWTDLNAPGALAAAYRRAWGTVLPAVDEAQGMVVLESLASGTPVVAADSGAPPELLDGRAEIGRLFAPDDGAALARAMGEVLDLVGEPGTAEACRVRSADYGLEPVLDRHERLYGSLV
jgi:glycosyltransferase involved in cell wall biosynthesis